MGSLATRLAWGSPCGMHPMYKHHTICFCSPYVHCLYGLICVIFLVAV